MLTAEDCREVQKILKDASQHQAVKPLPQYEMQPLCVSDSAMITLLPLPLPLPLFPIFTPHAGTSISQKKKQLPNQLHSRKKRHGLAKSVAEEVTNVKGQCQ
jgi:hypothetical protein